MNTVDVIVNYVENESLFSSARFAVQFECINV